MQKKIYLLEKQVYNIYLVSFTSALKANRWVAHVHKLNWKLESSYGIFYYETAAERKHAKNTKEYWTGCRLVVKKIDCNPPI